MLDFHEPSIRRHVEEDIIKGKMRVEWPQKTSKGICKYYYGKRCKKAKRDVEVCKLKVTNVINGSMNPGWPPAKVLETLDIPLRTCAVRVHMPTKSPVSPWMT